MDVSLLCLLRVVHVRPLRRADHSFRGVLLGVRVCVCVCVCVWRNSSIWVVAPQTHKEINEKCKGKVIPLQAWCGPEGG